MLRIGRTEHSVVTENVSARGLFLRTTERPSDRLLVKLVLSPEKEEPLEVTAMTAWHLPADNAFGRAPGIGLQFYGLGRDQSQALGRLLARAAREETKAAAEVKKAPPPIRQHPRHMVSLRMRPVDVKQLLELYTRDISAGGMFVETPTVLAVGDRAVFELIHPDVREGFRLPCVVRHVSKDPARKGLGLEFVDLDDKVRRDLHTFVTQTVAELESDDLLVDEDDPKLA
jgi:Tfp pilus assembly protein PilZ